MAIKNGRTKQTFYSTIEGAITAAIQADEDGFDAYYGLATYANDESRRNDNVLQLKSLFLDLDCGASKDYADQAEALGALKSFCKSLRLPTPTLVNSGRGIHVYWMLTEAVSRETWLPVAERLKSLCKEHGMYADPAVTADSARILRVPGTHNHKDTPPKPVEILGHAAPPVELETFKKLLGDDPFVPTRSAPRGEPSAVMQAIMGNYTSRFKTIMMKTAKGEGCEQLKIAYTQQPTISEPQWRAALSIAKFCVDAGTSIHKISDKHPTYTYEETEHKVDLIKGPYTCVKFDEYNEGVCPNCPHWAKIKSPITLGREVAEAEGDDNIVEVPVNLSDEVPTVMEIEIPKYPFPYFRGKNGGVYKRIRGEEEDIEVLVYHNDIYLTKRIRDAESGEAMVVRLHLPNDGIREFTIPLTALASRDECKKLLAMHGVAMVDMKELMAYITTWVNDLQMKTVAQESHRQFGWTDNMKSFVLGGREIFADSMATNPPSAPTRDLIPFFEPVGTLEGWKEMAEFYNRPGFEMHQFAMGISFGAPLMEYFPIHGMDFHMFSKDSGLGKTTAMLAGLSVWGKPEGLLLHDADTYASKMNRCEVYKNLPFCFDELTNTPGKELSDFGYQLHNGRQRNRMSGNTNAERSRGRPWKSIGMSTGNTSAIERISAFKAMPKAEAQRILEHRATKIRFETKEETDRFSESINLHYGHAGPIYIQYILRNKKEVGELLTKVQRRVDELAGLASENRFWSVCIACAITGLIIAKKLGLIGYDIKVLTTWAANVAIESKTLVREMDEDTNAIIADYLAENVNNILRIKSTDDRRKLEGSALEHLVVPETTPRGTLVARYETDLKKLYRMIKPLREWCAKQQINYSGLVDNLKAAPTNAKRNKIRLGKGTHIDMPPTDVIIIDTNFDELVSNEPVSEAVTGDN